MKKILLLVGFLAFSIGFSQEHNWGYEGDEAPEYWGKSDENEQCTVGKYQSPINITKSKLDKKLPKVIFNYISGKVQDIVDNGHSLQFDFKEGSTITYKDKIYTLIQFHAHEESEHTIDGIRYPLELHFVHKAEDDSILVIGVMVKDGEENSYFKKLEVIKNLNKHEKIDTDILFNPEVMYPKNKSYYTYKGSLTTPPCTENVTWIVFKNPIMMTEEEIDEVEHHLPKKNNRPIQPLNGRIISNN